MKNAILLSLSVALLAGCGPTPEQIEAEENRKRIAEWEIKAEKTRRENAERARAKQAKVTDYKYSMQFACEDMLKELNQFKVKFPILAGPMYKSDCIMKTKRCEFHWGKGQARIQNQYGTWRDISARCYTLNDKIVSFSVNGQKVF